MGPFYDLIGGLGLVLLNAGGISNHSGGNGSSPRSPAGRGLNAGLGSNSVTVGFILSIQSGSHFSGYFHLVDFVIIGSCVNIDPGIVLLWLYQARHLASRRNGWRLGMSRYTSSNITGVLREKAPQEVKILRVVIKTVSP